MADMNSKSSKRHNIWRSSEDFREPTNFGNQNTHKYISLWKSSSALISSPSWLGSALPATLSTTFAAGGVVRSSLSTQAIFLLNSARHFFKPSWWNENVLIKLQHWFFWFVTSEHLYKLTTSFCAFLGSSKGMFMPGLRSPLEKASWSLEIKIKKWAEMSTVVTSSRIILN